MRTLKLTKDSQKNILESLLKRSPNNYTEYESTVNEIINNVKENRDKAVFEYTKKFDKADVDASNIRVTEENIKKHNKRLLISVDEVTNCEFVKVFVSSFQIFLRQDYPIFLLMTGLFENIYDLQNDKALTFLYRAPKIMLEPLSFTAVRKHYMDIFELDQSEADKMAALTKGYPFAFQVLGYLYWENRDDHTIEDILPEYDQCLDEYVYSKIWSELSELDKKILLEISVSGEEKVKEIREKLDMNSGLFSVYRDRLKRKGIIDTSEYGKITLTLPRFEEFVKTRQM